MNDPQDGNYPSIDFISTDFYAHKFRYFVTREITV